jgi:Cu/Ag efflux pump CusA
MFLETTWIPKVQMSLASWQQSDRAFYEIEHPMAMIIVGGIFTWTLLNLVAMPVLSLHYAKTKKLRAK